MSGHARQTTSKGVHTPIAWTFANAAARNAFTPTDGNPTLLGQLTADDLNRFSLDLDTGAIYRLTSTTPTWALVSSAAATDERIINWQTGNRQNATNIYGRAHTNNFTNQNPFIAPFALELIAMTATTEAVETWTAEVHTSNSWPGTGLSLLAGATLPITGAQFGSVVFGSPIAIPAGAAVGTFINGSNILRPSIQMYLRVA